SARILTDYAGRGPPDFSCSCIVRPSPHNGKPQGPRESCPPGAVRTGRAREGPLADKSTQTVLEALRRAAADPAGVPLHASKQAPGLFAATAAARPLARRCVDEGLLRVVRTETRGKAAQEYCAITEKGLHHLLRQTSPRQVLEDLVRVLEAREAQVAELVETA